MIRAIRRGRERHEGASAVEFAIVLPVLLLFLFGIIEFGLAFARAQGMEAAAREGARLAAIGRTVDAADVEAVVADVRVPFISSSDVDVEVIDKDGAVRSDGWCASAGDPVTVRVLLDSDPSVRSRYAISIPLWPGEAEPSFLSDGTFRCEARHLSP